MAPPGLWRLAVAVALAAQHVAALAPAWTMFHQARARQRAGAAVTTLAEDSPIKAYNLSVPVDHFHNESRYEPHSHETFPLRYWVDSSRYRRGGPVIVLHSGEAPGDERLPYLERGIVALLAEATHGVGVVLEHRYYGTSIPVPDMTVRNMRFLTTEQTLADNAYFAAHARFPGLDGQARLAPPAAPWLIYGGSYAGSVAALTRKLYPDAYWGAISSSGVPAAIDDYWQYLEAARLFAPAGCGPATQRLTHVVDRMLLSGDAARAAAVKALFGLADLRDDEFGTAISRGIMGLQSAQWDPAEDSTALGTYCALVTAPAPLFASTAHLRPAVEAAVDHAGYAAGPGRETLTNQMLNYVGYVRDAVRRDMADGCRGQSQRECYSMRLAKDSTGQDAGFFRSWMYQTCTQWGFYQTGTGVPGDQLPLISRAITLEYASILCPLFFNITTRPDVESINKLGGFNLSYPRLAFVDGAQDPWRQASPHAIGLADRPSTTSQPFILLDPGVHHWDENGVADEDRGKGLPPKQVADVQALEVEFVKAWLKEWEGQKGPDGAASSDKSPPAQEL